MAASGGFLVASLLGMTIRLLRSRSGVIGVSTPGSAGTIKPFERHRRLNSVGRQGQRFGDQDQNSERKWRRRRTSPRTATRPRLAGGDGGLPGSGGIVHRRFFLLLY